MVDNKMRKGIILAGGTGSRLSPITVGVSKQLLPIYNKPTIYYPLTTLMLAGIRNILIITNKADLSNFKKLLGNGKQWGINIKYSIQEKPNGIAEAFLIAEDFISEGPVILVLGDNIFFGDELQSKLINNIKINKGATIFTQAVNEPQRYGIVEFDRDYKAISIEEKPDKPKTNFAITGLYFFDKKVVEFSKNLKPSKRGELEITDLLIQYLRCNELNVQIFSRGCGWFDTGTFDSLHEANSLIMTLEKRQGLKIGYPEEVAWRNGWINDKNFEKEAYKYKNLYGEYLLNLLQNKNAS